MIGEFTAGTAISYSVFEIGLIGIEFYLNLFVLLPFLLERKKPTFYGLAIVGMMSIIFSTYYLFGLSLELLANEIPRAILTFFLNHGFFIFISFMFWYFSKYRNERSEKEVLQKENRKLELEIQVINEDTINAKNNLLIKSKHTLIKIVVDDILYIESLHKYIRVVTSEKSYTTLYGITAIMDELPKSKFYRCHRSFIVNVDEVVTISGNSAIVGDHKVPISKGNKEDLLKRMGKQIG